MSIWDVFEVFGRETNNHIDDIPMCYYGAAIRENFLILDIGCAFGTLVKILKWILKA